MDIANLISKINANFILHYTIIRLYEMRNSNEWVEIVIYNYR